MGVAGTALAPGELDSFPPRRATSAISGARLCAAVCGVAGAGERLGSTYDLQIRTLFRVAPERNGSGQLPGQLPGWLACCLSVWHERAQSACGLSGGALAHDSASPMHARRVIVLGVGFVRGVGGAGV